MIWFKKLQNVAFQANEDVIISRTGCLYGLNQTSVRLNHLDGMHLIFLINEQVLKQRLLTMRLIYHQSDISRVSATCTDKQNLIITKSTLTCIYMSSTRIIMLRRQIFSSPTTWFITCRSLKWIEILGDSLTKIQNKHNILACRVDR